MSHKLFQITSYLSYWLDAVDEHSLHSPFLFDFYSKVVKVKKQPVGPVPAFEHLRHKLLADTRSIPVHDLGSRNHNGARRIAAIARTSLSPARLSGLYSRIVHHFQYKTIVELGTSFGINTLYLAQRKDSKVTTFEGVASIADIARLTFEFASAKNVEMIVGNIDQTLPGFLQSVRKIDFVLMDANHRYEPTLLYFERLLPRLTDRSIVVLDDIHSSKGMERAWEQIKGHELVYASADLYRCGILFFDPSLNKQHVILQF